MEQEESGPGIPLKEKRKVSVEHNTKVAYSPANCIMCGSVVLSVEHDGFLVLLQRIVLSEPALFLLLSQICFREK